MSCECKETAFNKLRECWSRHHKKGMEGECECCCSGPKSKSKVKGKFGIAYVINTPNRKCKPCGWEVEFNDTLSEVENNCKKMMHWVTCPPLGECQNNETNLCCCSENAKKLLNVQQACCQCTKKDDGLCRCCRQTKKRNSGDGCNKKEQQRASCCYEKPSNKNQCDCSKTKEIRSQCCLRATSNNIQCCCKGSTNKTQCCSKSKPKSICCRAQEGQAKYLESIKRCTECCCIISDEDKKAQCLCRPQDDDSDVECCCNKSKKKPNCCCQNSDSQSSIDSCGCGQTASRNDCCCNCSGCKCINKNKRDKRKKQKHKETKKGEQEGKHQLKEATSSKGKTHTKSKPSKNWQGPEPTKERHKSNEKTPFTIITHKVSKKEPDTGQEQVDKELEAIKPPTDESARIMQDSIENFEEIKLSQVETEINSVPYEDGLNKDTKEKLPQKNSANRPSLLKRIKRTRRKEMNLIHSPQEIKQTVKEQDQAQSFMKNIRPEKPTRKRKLQNGPALLKKIKQGRKKEMEAIHPKGPIENEGENVN